MIKGIFKSLSESVLFRFRDGNPESLVVSLVTSYSMDFSHLSLGLVSPCRLRVADFIFGKLYYLRPRAVGQMNRKIISAL